MATATAQAAPSFIADILRPMTKVSIDLFEECPIDRQANCHRSHLKKYRETSTNLYIL